MLRPGTQDALISRRENMPTSLSHAELVRDVAPKVKAQAFFSARVAEAHILDRLREVSDGYSRGEFGLGEARNRLKDFLRAEGYDPHEGGMRNLASTGRLNLILKQNASMAHAAAEWKRMHDPDAMKVYPYVRYHARGDSRTRSEHAELDGRIFRKDDPFLSTHTPPWEFNCRCYLEEITEKEAGKTPDLIQPPTPPEEVTVDSKSGFSFDPAHAFEKFDYDAIKNPEVRAKAKEGVEMILAGKPETARGSVMPDGSDKSGQAATSGTAAGSGAGAGAGNGAPPADSGAGGSSGSGNPPKYNGMMLNPDKNEAISHFIYQDNPEEFLKEKAEEMKRRVATESGNKVFPKNPKEFLQGEELAKAEENAKKAVPSEVMERTDDFIREKGEKYIEPFLHYSSRPANSPNLFIREAGYKDGAIDWDHAKIPEGKKPEDLQKAIKNTASLQELLDIMPKFHGTVYRGCAFEKKEQLEDYLRDLLGNPKSLRGFISTTPDPVIAHHYASGGIYKVVVVVPNSQNGVYFGPHSKHPEDEEALISYKFYLKGLTTFEDDGIVYVLAEEVPR